MQGEQSAGQEWAISFVLPQSLPEGRPSQGSRRYENNIPHTHFVMALAKTDATSVFWSLAARAREGAACTPLVWFLLLSWNASSKAAGRIAGATEKRTRAFRLNPFDTQDLALHPIEVPSTYHREPKVALGNGHARAGSAPRDWVWPPFTRRELGMSPGPGFPRLRSRSGCHRARDPSFGVKPGGNSRKGARPEIMTSIPGDHHTPVAHQGFPHAVYPADDANPEGQNRQAN